MQRLFIDQPLSAESSITLDDKQGHYLLHVLRMKTGDEILVFNGHDGEWKAAINHQKKNSVALKTAGRTKPQKTEWPLHLLFAPIKRGHGDLTVEKATECGATRLSPVITQHTNVTRVPTDRYRAIATEAAEQCERLSVPAIDEPQTLAETLAGWNPSLPLILCAEQGDAAPLANAIGSTGKNGMALLIGPEGGFSQEEFSLLRQQKYIVPAHLGPRILRADTAAIAAMAIMQAMVGDWGKRD